MQYEGERPAPTVVDAGTESSQRIEDADHGPYARRRVAVERDVASRQRGRCGRDEPHDGAREATVDPGIALRPAWRDAPVVAVICDGCAQRAQRSNHEQRVAGAKRASQLARRPGEGCEYECAVGDRLGAGQHDRRVDWPGCRRRVPQLVRHAFEPSGGASLGGGLASAGDELVRFLGHLRAGRPTCERCLAAGHPGGPLRVDSRVPGAPGEARLAGGVEAGDEQSTGE